MAIEDASAVPGGLSEDSQGTSQVAGSAALPAHASQAQSPAPAQLTDYRLQQRDYLLRIARAMTERLSLREVLTLVIRSAVEMTGGQAGAIVMRGDGDEMEPAVSYRLEEKVVEHLRPMVKDAPRLPGPFAEVAAPSSTFVEIDPDHPQHMLSLPLTAAGAEIGQILVLRSEGAAVFTPLDGELLRAFADQAAVAIHNARLHERLMARERQLDSIVESNPAALVLTDAGGEIVIANPALEAITGCACDSVVGLPLETLLELDDGAGSPVGIPWPSAGESTEVRGYLATGPQKSRPYLQVTVSPLPGSDHGSDGHLVSVVDLSAFREAEDAKQTFLAGLSHELKTPLSLIRGYAEILQLPQVRGDEQILEESLDIIISETDHLTEMVERLLQAARLESGAPVPDLDFVDLLPEVERLVQEFRDTDRDHNWELQTDGDVPVILGDRLQLRQVLQNLLDNASKYSPPGTTIRVAARAEGGGVRVDVQDEGSGISPQDQQSLFRRFFRASDTVEGTGLGLYMSRAIVEAHGGEIGVRSVEGEGSTFTVTLPGRERGAGHAREVSE